MDSMTRMHKWLCPHRGGWAGGVHRNCGKVPGSIEKKWAGECEKASQGTSVKKSALGAS